MFSTNFKIFLPLRALGSEYLSPQFDFFLKFSNKRYVSFCFQALMSVIVFIVHYFIPCIIVSICYKSVSRYQTHLPILVIGKLTDYSKWSSSDTTTLQCSALSPDLKIKTDSKKLLNFLHCHCDFSMIFWQSLMCTSYGT